MENTVRWTARGLALGAVLGLFLAVPARAVPVPGGSVDPTTIPKYVIPLVIPPVMPASSDTATPAADYNIAVRQFGQQILPGGLWNALSGRSDGFGPTTVWSYGRAEDPLPAGGVAPAPDSSFNYPAYTIENLSGQMTKVRWINELVENPDACFHGTPTGTDCNFLPHLLPVDQTLHWANPPKADCVDHMGMLTDPNRTDCETRNDAPYTGPVPMVVHVHGAHVNAASDGYPEAWWLPAADNIDPSYATTGALFSQWAPANTVPGSAFYAYENTQPATTIWYHDHSLGMTRLNVYAGPAGFWLIRGGAYDTAAGILPGPAPAAGDSVLELNAPTLVEGTADKRRIIREIPIVMQDRSFDYVDAGGNVLPDASGATGTKLWYPASRTDFDGFVGPYITPFSESDISGIWNPEAFFNTFVVNGVAWPYLDVAQERYRFRLLNGCNSRTLNLAMTVVSSPDAGLVGQELPFFQIGGDQGFLPKVAMIRTGFIASLPGDGTLPTVTPAEGNLQGLLMMPAERADVIVDFSGLPSGTVVRVVNTAGDGPFGGLDPADQADPGTTGQVFQFVVDSTLNRAGGDPSTPPASLLLPHEAALGPASNTRKVSLNEMESHQVCIEVDVDGAFVQTLFTRPHGDATFMEDCMNAVVTEGNAAVPAGPRQALLGDVVFDPVAGGLVAVPERWTEPVSENPLLGATETWEIFNTTMDAHPIHIHLVRFQVVEREDLDIDMMTGVMTPLGTRSGPLPNEDGYKDTVVAYPNQITRVKATFDLPGRYVWHCHIVEHEDNEMMRPFEVFPTACGPIVGLYGPAASTTGKYRVYWEASAGTPEATYVLTENDAEIYRGPNRYVDFVGKPNGSYSYAVRAIKDGQADSPIKGPLTTAVTLTCGPIVGLYGPTASTTGKYRIYWEASAGTAEVTYVLTENGVEIYRGPNRYVDFVNKPSGSYSYAVKAVRDGYVDSAVKGPLTTAVTLTCGPIVGLYGPTASTTGKYRIYWEASAGTAEATYVLTENGVEIYRGPNRYVDFVNKPSGSYSYAVKAVRDGYVDSAVKGPLTTAVTLTCGPIRGIYGPTANTTGTYRIYWEASYGTPGVTYILTENGVPIYTGLNRYVDFVNKPGGSYSYAVRAVKTDYVDSAVRGPITTVVTR